MVLVLINYNNDVENNVFCTQKQNILDSKFFLLLIKLKILNLFLQYINGVAIALQTFEYIFDLNYTHLTRMPPLCPSTYMGHIRATSVCVIQNT